MKRGLAPSSVCSALPTPRRVRLQRSIVQYLKSRNTRRPARGGTETLRLGKLTNECRLQPAIARQAKHVVDAVRFTPPHQSVVGEAAVGAQDDVHARPALADLPDDARHLLDGAITARDVCEPLASQKQVPTTEHVERQVAVLVIIAMEEPAFLRPVQRDVGVVEIQHDLTWRSLMRVEEEIDQQRIDPRIVAIDLVILRCMASRRVLQAIERALASQRLA